MAGHGDHDGVHGALFSPFSDGYPPNYPPNHEHPGTLDYLYSDEESHMNWTDAFPHDFTGWGPQTPDLDHDAVDETGYSETKYKVYRPERDLDPDPKQPAHEHEAGGRFHVRTRFDDAYLNWRAEQLQQLEDEYAVWDAEHPAGPDQQVKDH